MELFKIGLGFKSQFSSSIYSRYVFPLSV